MRKFILLISVLWFSLSCFSTSNAVKVNSASKLVALMFFNNNIKQNVHQTMINMIDNSYIVSSSAEAQKKTKITMRIKKLMKAIMLNYPWDEMKAEYAEIYAKSFTLDELNGLIKFYQSPAGQKFLSRKPKLTRELLKNIHSVIKKNYLKNKNTTELKKIDPDKMNIKQAMKWLVDYESTKISVKKNEQKTEIILEIIMDVLMHEFTCPSLNVLLNDIYSANFSYNELNALLDFYSSPLGMKFLNKHVLLGKETRKICLNLQKREIKNIDIQFKNELK
ncbi:MAG TPA: DUF2059 domain-containing protein [Victivallales bacterium]|nr:DUF2059 domain-containing protein [Victivallales bacterium]